jgi:hypothetical protein
MISNSNIFFIYFAILYFALKKITHLLFCLVILSRYLVWKWTRTILEVLFLGKVFVSIL